jgi:hypothetical protein
LLTDCKCAGLSYFLLKILVFAPVLATIAGWIVAPWFLHPVRRPLPPDLLRQAYVTLSQIGTHREDFDVRARWCVAAGLEGARGKA